jgi:mannose-6-phosphate isomerase-like protein (cupin superfamily)
MAPKKVNVAEKLNGFDEYWQPRIVGALNGQHVKVVKLKGEFVWHHHDNEDELFYVLAGRIVIKFKDSDIELTEGEFVIVPRGVEHKPVAQKDAHVLLFEPDTTINTGNVVSDRTVAHPESI